MWNDIYIFKRIFLKEQNVKQEQVQVYLDQLEGEKMKKRKHILSNV